MMTAQSARERAEVMIDSQLGRVLDYAGVAIWDWSHELIDQTESLPSLLGADSAAPFTPDAMRKFIHKDDLKKLETEVFSAEDGPFDAVLKLFDERRVRIRGARAAVDGELERIVAFVELADAKFAERAPVAQSADKNDGKQVRDATRAAVVPAALTANFSTDNLVARSSRSFR